MISVKEWYNLFAEDYGKLHEEKDIPGYETFKQVKRKWFSVSNLIVYYPPNSNDPRMSKDQRKQGLESAQLVC